MDNLGDVFEFPTGVGIPKHPATAGNNACRGDEKHRLVVNGISDLPYLWGIQLSGIGTFGGKYIAGRRLPGALLRAGSYERGGFTVPGLFPYQNVNLRAPEGFPESRDGEGGRPHARLFNAFNRDNLGCYDTGSRLNGDGRRTRTSARPTAW